MMIVMVAAVVPPSARPRTTITAGGVRARDDHRSGEDRDHNDRDCHSGCGGWRSVGRGENGSGVSRATLRQAGSHNHREGGDNAPGVQWSLLGGGDSQFLESRWPPEMWGQLMLQLRDQEWQLVIDEKCEMVTVKIKGQGQICPCWKEGRFALPLPTIITY